MPNGVTKNIIAFLILLNLLWDNRIKNAGKLQNKDLADVRALGYYIISLFIS
jgi:hypothetical protein